MRAVKLGFQVVLFQSVVAIVLALSISRYLDMRDAERIAPPVLTIPATYILVQEREHFPRLGQFADVYVVRCCKIVPATRL